MNKFEIKTNKYSKTTFIVNVVDFRDHKSKLKIRQIKYTI